MEHNNRDSEKISVAFATYNGERYLRELLDSVYSQTCRPYEVVACDDHSTDGTVSILEEYAVTRGLKYHVNERNLGYIKNFEKVMSLCEGDYIAPCDQDDRWLPGKLEMLAKKIGNNSLICSDAILIDEFGNRISRSYRNYSRIHVPPKRKQLHSLIFHNHIMGCASLFRKNDLVPMLYNLPECIPHDWWVAVLASIHKGIRYIKTPLIEYRLHKKNIIGATRKSLFYDITYYYEQKRSGLNHFDTVYNVKNSLMVINELEKRSVIDPWMASLKSDLQTLLEDLQRINYHPTALRIGWKYLFYFRPSLNPFGKIMFLIDNYRI